MDPQQNKNEGMKGINVKFNELMIDQQEMDLKEMQKVIKKGRNVIIRMYN